MDNGNKPVGNEKPNGNSFRKRIIIWIVSILVLLAVVIGFMGYRYVQSSLQPLDPKDKNVVQVDIPMGASNKQIGSILQDKHLVKSGMVFNYYVKSHNFTNFRAGYYQLTPAMTLSQIATRLQKGGSSEPIQNTDGKVLVREGETIDQIAKEIPNTTDFSKAEFMSLMKDTKFFDSLVAKYPRLLRSAKDATGVRYRLEGYLAPATYAADKKMTLKQIVTNMVAKTDTELRPYYSEISKKKLSVQEVLSLSSIVEREGVTQKDRHKIAGVFFNRIDDNMALQSDITVQYAIRSTKKNLSYADLKVDSPYNLYVHTGYGPGPFNNPSIDAIKAVLKPTDRSEKYLYFIANTKTGKVYYSKTFAQHQKLTDKLSEANK